MDDKVRQGRILAREKKYGYLVRELHFGTNRNARKPKRIRARRDFANQKKIWGRGDGEGERGREREREGEVESVDRQLVAEVVQDVVRCRRETARVGENEVGGDKEVGEVVGGDVAGDRLVVSSGARGFQDGLVVARVNSDKTKDSGA